MGLTMRIGSATWELFSGQRKRKMVQIPHVQNKPTFKKKGSSWKKKGKDKVANPKPNPALKAKPGPAADNE